MKAYFYVLGALCAAMFFGARGAVGEMECAVEYVQMVTMTKDNCLVKIILEKNELLIVKVPKGKIISLNSEILNSIDSFDSVDSSYYILKALRSIKPPLPLWKMVSLEGVVQSKSTVVL